jgi:hypothetical protein
MKQSRQENIIYLVVWGLLFAAPLLSLYVRTLSDDSDAPFRWAEVLFVWQRFAVYLVLFLIHNFLLAPLFFARQESQRNRRVAYFSIMVLILSAFTIYQCSHRAERRGPKPPMERFDHHEPPRFEKPAHGFEDKDMPRRHRPEDTPPPIVGERDIMAIILLVLMFAANLGVKGYYRGLEDRKRLERLERENLEQQLEYLRYQINPHFFMNTLNNIHALVDIDPEQAKETILELSKMMRFVLYEGNKQGVPLSRELDFIRHYMALMQLRYTDKVHIDLNLPDEVPDHQIPPLILVTFIENAFKHGVSYQHDSFVEVKVSVAHNELQFTCRNSKADKPNEEKGGVGLSNVRKRLNLLYGSSYALRIHNAEDYSVELNIPLS